MNGWFDDFVSLYERNGLDLLSISGVTRLLPVSMTGYFILELSRFRAVRMSYSTLGSWSKPAWSSSSVGM